MKTKFSKCPTTIHYLHKSIERYIYNETNKSSPWMLFSIRWHRNNFKRLETRGYSDAMFEQGRSRES